MSLLGKATLFRCRSYAAFPVHDFHYVACTAGSWWLIGSRYGPLTRDQARAELQRAGILDSDGRATP